MRNIYLPLLLSAALLTGCGAQVADRADLPQETPPTVQTQARQELRYQVTLEPFERTAYAEDGQLLATYHVQVPVLTAVLEDGTPLTEPTGDAEQKAAAAAETFNRKFAIWTEEEAFRELTDSARWEMEQRLQNGQLFPANYALDLSCSVYETERLISVAGLCYSNTGGAHPNTWQLGWNFDLETGTFFDGALLTADSSGFQSAVAEELIRQAGEIARENGMAPEEMYWPEYESVLRDWVNYTVYFDATGMNVVFSPYELAAYAAGAQEFHFSYEKLAPLLSKQGCAVLGLECDQDEMTGN